MHGVDEPRLHELIEFVILSESLRDDGDDEDRWEDVDQVPDEAPPEVGLASQAQLPELVYQEVQTEEVEQS
jgi:hypothetical protein